MVLWVSGGELRDHQQESINIPNKGERVGLLFGIIEAVCKFLGDPRRVAVGDNLRRAREEDARVGHHVEHEDGDGRDPLKLGVLDLDEAALDVRRGALDHLRASATHRSSTLRASATLRALATLRASATLANEPADLASLAVKRAVVVEQFLLQVEECPAKLSDSALRDKQVVDLDPYHGGTRDLEVSKRLDLRKDKRRCLLELALEDLEAAFRLGKGDATDAALAGNLRIRPFVLESNTIII